MDGEAREEIEERRHAKMLENAKPGPVCDSEVDSFC